MCVFIFLFLVREHELAIVCVGALTTPKRPTAAVNFQNWIIRGRAHMITETPYYSPQLRGGGGEMKGCSPHPWRSNLFPNPLATLFQLSPGKRICRLCTETWWTFSLPRHARRRVFFITLSGSGLHDVCEALPSASPASEALAVELEGLEPGQGQARIISLKKYRIWSILFLLYKDTSFNKFFMISFRAAGG